MTTRAEPIILVDNLTRVFRTYRKRPGFVGGLIGLVHRTYEETAAADRISFSINEGEFVGFLGPNGAGKTTVLKMLSGLIHPTSGSARVAGFNPRERRNEYRRMFALVLGQKNQLWWDLPAIESFHLLRHIYGIPAETHRKRLDELVELLGVGAKLNVMVRELSLGERMKMELVAALLHGPQILFLDEPTIGLDVVSQRSVRHFLRDYNQRHRVTILLTSHYMADIEALCKRVIVIHHGRLIYDGRLDRLDIEGARHKVIRFRPLDSWPADWVAPGKRLADEDGSITVEVPGDRIVEASQFILATAPVADITIEEVPLEEIIHQLFSSQT
ncbi:MAG: ABC transporter ATP-binding protein [Opitutaceae bacterium]